MKRNWLVYFVALGVFLGLANCGKSDSKVEEYSAEQVHISPDGKQKAVWKFYGSSQKTRMEMGAPWGKGLMITIVREDKKIVWTLIPDKKVYIEKALDEADLQTFQQFYKGKIKEEDLGTETVNGYKCHKKRVETVNKVMGREIKTRMTIWKSDRFPWPLRTQSEKGEITELRNIKIGRQPAKLFEVPAGYRKVANFMEAMKNSF